jgi:hypothetical protein
MILELNRFLSRIATEREHIHGVAVQSRTARQLIDDLRDAAGWIGNVCLVKMKDSHVAYALPV